MTVTVDVVLVLDGLEHQLADLSQECLHIKVREENVLARAEFHISYY